MDEVSISLSGNYAATAGYGPNQISTVLGIGCFLLCTRLFTIRNRMINLIDVSLLVLMGYRAVVTFSRGGVFTALVCVVAFLIFFYFKQEAKKMQGTNTRIIFIVVVFVGVWLFTSLETSGLIGNRYTNRDAAGQLKDDISTGRAELIETELTAFYHHPLIGIGVGKGINR